MRREDRKQRVPLGTPQPKLSAPERKGYRRRWVNDAGGRLQDAERAGYAFVEEEARTDGTGTRVSRRVGVKEDGSGMNAYLMEIKEEWYAEDQAEKQKQVDAVDEAIRRGNINGQVGQDGRYVPSQGITYRR